MQKKKELIEIILRRLYQEFESINQAARAAHDAATHEESKAEDHHDTRGLEASYLAGAQVNRAAELKHLSSIFRMLELRDFQKDDPITLGALFVLEMKGRQFYYFLMTEGGGISVQWEGKTVHVITLQAPLGEAVFGKKAGQEVEVETQNAVREYRVVSVA